MPAMGSASSLPLILKRHWLPALATFSSVLVAAGAYLATTPRQYETSARLMLDEKQVSVSALGRDLAKLGDSSPTGSSPIANQAELVKSERVLRRAVAEVQAQGATAVPTIADLERGLKVKIVPATNILELIYSGRDPDLAAKSLNAVLAAMVAENIETIRAEARSVRTFLESELPQQRAILERAEASENQYRQSSGVISAVDQTRKLIEGLGTIENQERELVARVAELRTQNRSLQQVIDAETLQSAYNAVRIGQDEELKSLRVKLMDLETRVIDGRSRLGDQHPDLLALVEQRDATRTLYANQLAQILPGQSTPPEAANDALSQNLISKLITSEVERVALEQKLAIVQAERVGVQTRLSELPLKQQPLTTLTRQREEAEASLKFLQAKLQEARLAEAQLISNLQILAQAEPPDKAKWPSAPAVLVLAVALGSLLAAGIVLLLEMMDDRLHDASEVKQLSDVPLLGALPKLPAALINLEASEQFLDSMALVEPYRMLLKRLEFRGTKRSRLLVVSSAIAGEGKSVVVSHLAVVSAMLQQRTLIIDADLRQPAQHRLLNVAAQPGIADIVHQKRSLLQAVQPTAVKNLWLLTCGELHDRPSQVIESDAMRSLLVEATSEYDLVIVDTPPVSSCVDAVALSRSSDGLLLVIRPNLTLRESLRRAVADLIGNHVPIVGTVINGSTTSVEAFHHKLIHFPNLFQRKYSQIPHNSTNQGAAIRR